MIPYPRGVTQIIAHKLWLELACNLQVIRAIALPCHVPSKADLRDDSNLWKSHPYSTTMQMDSRPRMPLLSKVLSNISLQGLQKLTIHMQGDKGD